MSRTPRRIAGGRRTKISYRAMKEQKDLVYNIEQLFKVVQDQGDILEQLITEQQEINKQLAVVNKKVEELRLLIP